MHPFDFIKNDNIPINVQDGIDVQGGFFSKKTINMQTQIRPCRGEFFLKIDKRACTFIRHTRGLGIYSFVIGFNTKIGKSF